MGPFSSFFVLMDSNGSVCVCIGLYASIWVFMGPYIFFLRPYGF